MFQEALLFRAARIMCYSTQAFVKVAGQIPPPFTWHIYQIIVDCFSPIVITCVTITKCACSTLAPIH